MQGAAEDSCPLIATVLFHALCGAQRSSDSLPTDGAGRVLDFSRVMRYNSGRGHRAAVTISQEKQGKSPLNTRNNTEYHIRKVSPDTFLPELRSGRPLRFP